MAVFLPRTATRLMIDSSPVLDGQLIIAVDTGEIFLDYNGRRIALLQGSSEAAGEDESISTDYAVVNSTLLQSASISGGGSGEGLVNAPEVEMDSAEPESITDYNIVS